MNLEEAKANIGKEVVLDESTKPYGNLEYKNLNYKYDLYGLNSGHIIGVNDLGEILVEFIDFDDLKLILPLNPCHLKYKE